MPLSFDVFSEDAICEDDLEFYASPIRKHQEKEQFPMIRFSCFQKNPTGIGRRFATRLRFNALPTGR